MNASEYSRDGEYLNIASGKREDSQKTQAQSVSLRWTPADSFDAALRVGFTRQDDGQAALGYLPHASANCYLATDPYFCGVVPTNDYVNLYSQAPAQLSDPAPFGVRALAYSGSFPFYNGTHQTAVRSSLVANYRFGDFTLSSLTGWDASHDKLGYDGSYNGNSPLLFVGNNFFINNFREDSHALSQEFRLSSPRQSRLRYLAGLYGYYETTAHADMGLPADTLSYGAQDAYTFSVHDYAIFGQLEFDIVKDLTASLEARWQRDSIHFDDPLRKYSRFAEYDAFNPRAVLNYRWRPEALVYASVGRGTKPGGFNGPSAPSSVPDAFQEERALAYEVGAKTEWFDHHLRLNAAIYYTQLRDFVVTETVLTAAGTPTSIDANAAKAHTQGLEFEAAARLAPGLTLTASYAYTDAKFDDYVGFQELCRLAGSYKAACLSTPVSSAAGKQLPNAPRNQFSLQLDWSHPLTATTSLFIRPAYSYKSEVYDQAENLTSTGDQSLLDLRIGAEGTNWTVSLFGRNLLKEDHATYILRYIEANSFNFGGGFYNRAWAYALPNKQQFGAELRVRF